MKIHILSDLHNEFLRGGRFNPLHKWTGRIPETDADIIVLAGDIDTGTQGAEWAINEAERLSKKIIYVLGNHEYYGYKFNSLKEKIQNICEGSLVSCLDYGEYREGNVRIIGATLWTDYKAFNAIPKERVMLSVENALADHHKIRLNSHGSYKKFKPQKPNAKTLAGYASTAGDSIVAAKLLREFGFQSNKVIVKSYAGKQYVIFKGYLGARKIFRGTRYLTENPKVVRLAVGPKGVAKAVQGGFVLTVILSVGIEVFDYIIRDTATLSHLLGTITGDLIKIGISTIAAAVAGLAIGATAALIKAYADVGIKLNELEYEAARWYDYFEINPTEIMRLFGAPSSFSAGGY